MRSTRWTFGLVLAGYRTPRRLFCSKPPAPPSTGRPPPVKITKEEDHQRMMDLLHITELRGGRDGTGDQDESELRQLRRIEGQSLSRIFRTR